MNNPSPRHALSCLLLASSLLLCSCKPYEDLIAEKASLETELARTKEEAAFYEKKVVDLHEPVYTAKYNAQAQIQAATKTQAALEQEINELNGKTEKLDAGILKLRTKLDAYKAKHP